MANEKMFYTKEELSKITKDELKELTTFGPNNEYFYSELVSVEKISDNYSDDTKEYKFTFRDGETIFTQEKSTYNKVKTGKMRYDLIMKSAENAEQEIKIKEEFYKDVQSYVDTVLQKMDSDNTHSMNNIVESHVGDMKNIKSELEATVKKIKGDSESALKKVDDAARKINDLDIAGFEKKMKKLDKILEAFDALIE